MKIAVYQVAEKGVHNINYERLNEERKIIDIKNGLPLITVYLRIRMTKPTHMKASRDMLGHDVRGGQMILNEEGAKIVRLIFHKFVDEEKGTHVIARELREAGIKPMRNIQEWRNTVILRVIRNEKYCGDLVQKKTYTPDFLSHEKKYNRGQEEFVILKDHHEPIVSRELFAEANRILDEKSSSKIEEKRIKLIDLYMSGDVNRDEFTLKQDKC